MEKKLIFISLLIQLNLFSQSAVQRTEYFDWRKTKLAHTWFEFSDGTKHGSEKYYYDNGKLQVEYVYSKGDIKKALSYYNDGTQSLISNHYNRWILDGEVKYYNWLNGTRFLQYNGIAKKVANKDYDKVSFMEIYYAPNKKLLSFTDNGIIQEYIEYANSTRHTDELGNYVPKPVSSGQSKITVSKGIIKYGNCNGDEIVDGKFTKIGNVSAKIEGDKVVMTEITDLDSIIYTKIKSRDIQVELSPVMSVNPMNEYLNFNLSFKIPGSAVSDKIFVVNYNERYNDLSTLFNQYWKTGYSDVGLYRKYSRKNKNLKFESYTALENNTLVEKYKKWFHENGKLKEFWDGKKTEKYSNAGILIEKISADTVQRYFQNGSLALDSTSNYSKHYLPDGNVLKEITYTIKKVKDYSNNRYDGEDLTIVIPETYKIYNTQGEIVYQGEIKTTIKEKINNYNIYKKDIDVKYNSVQNNLNFYNQNKKIYYVAEKSTIDFNDLEHIGQAFIKLYNEKLALIKKELDFLSSSTKGFNNLNWDVSFYRSQDYNKFEIESNQIFKNIYLDFCINYYKNISPILDEMQLLEKKFVMISNSPDKRKIDKSLKKATSDSEIKSILGI